MRPASLMDRLGYAAKLITSRPGMLRRKLGWRFRALRAPRSGLHTWTINGHLRFTADLGADHSIRMMYLGAYDLELMQLLEDTVKNGDTVIDIGASIGYISAVAAGLVGPQGVVHSFEPDPIAAAALAALAAANPTYRIIVNQIALADQSGSAALDVSSDNIGWKTLVPGLMNQAARTVTVPMMTFDDYAERHGIREVRLIKIDTEGYEYRVLLGMQGFLKRTPHLPLIACEIAPSAFSRLGIDAETLERLISTLGYRVADPTEATRTVAIAELVRTSDVLLIPRERSHQE